MLASLRQHVAPEHRKPQPLRRAAQHAYDSPATKQHYCSCNRTAQGSKDVHFWQHMDREAVGPISMSM